jgi:hypothetical protein
MQIHNLMDKHTNEGLRINNQKNIIITKMY